MPNNSLIKQMFEKIKTKNARRAAAGLLSLGILAGSLTACGNVSNVVETKDNQGYEETVEDSRYTDKVTDTQSSTNAEQTETSVDKQTENNQSTNKPTQTEQSTNKPTESETTKELTRFEHSDVFKAAKQKWANSWDSANIRITEESGFVAKAAPYTFLAEQGVVYFDSQGMPHAYGDEDYSDYLTIQSEVYVDINNPGYNMYMVVQYRDGEIPKVGEYDNSVCLKTWMLKYTLDESTWRDVISMKGDYRLGYLVQEIDANAQEDVENDNKFKREVVSESVVSPDILKGYDIFKDLLYGVDQWCIDPVESNAVNFISDVDYEKMALTITYSDKNDPGKFSNYIFDLTGTEDWNGCLEYVNEDYRDSLPVDKIMFNSDSKLGKVLTACSVGGQYALMPSDKQKASATVAYELEALNSTTIHQSSAFNQYQSGQMPFEDINSLTESYVNSLNSGLTR